MAKRPQSIIEPIDAEFSEVVDKIFKETETMETAPDFRLHESDLTIPALRIANSKPGGFVTTSELISTLERVFNISGEDAEILEGRSDTKFSQVVRNIISHRKASSNMIARGFAEYDSERKGLQITVAGRKLLKSITG